MIKENLLDKCFNLILASIEKNGLLLKKGTCVDATLIQSSRRPLSKERRKELEEKPSSQIDTDADASVKGGKNYFGYKGHI